MKTKEIIEIATKALNEKDKEVKSQLVKKISNQIGYFDKASRYELYDMYNTESSKLMRTPSRAFPFSIYKHIFTNKYLKQLITSKELFAKSLEEVLVNNINENKIQKI